jgi:hypothetical protein
MLFLSGCVNDVAIELELRPPRAPDGTPLVPPEVRAYELRIYKLEIVEACPDLPTFATAATFAELAHAQAFRVEDGMGQPVGEIPVGRWAVGALARDTMCGARLFGCREIDIGVPSPSVVAIDMDVFVADTGCGACRTCNDGICEPVDAVCP